MSVCKTHSELIFFVLLLLWSPNGTRLSRMKDNKYLISSASIQEHALRHRHQQQERPHRVGPRAVPGHLPARPGLRDVHTVGRRQREYRR